MARSRTSLARVRRLPRRLWTLLFLKITDVVYVLDMKDYRAPKTTPPTGDVAVKPLVGGDHARLADAFGEVKAGELVNRLKTCFGVIGTVRGSVVGYSWMTDKPRTGEGDPPFFYDVAPKIGWFYFFDTFVDPAARGLGLATSLKRGLIEEVKRRGGHYCVATHEERNVAVIHVSEKLGFKLRGKMHYKRVFGSASKDLSGLPEGVRP